MKKQDQFSEWYKEQFSNFEEQPPADIWNNISDQIDIDDVWNKVDSKLNIIEKRKALILRSAFSLVILLLFFIVGMIIFPINDSSKTASINHNKKSKKALKKQSFNSSNNIIIPNKNNEFEKVKSNKLLSSNYSNDNTKKADLKSSKKSNGSILSSKIISPNPNIGTSKNETANALINTENQSLHSKKLQSNKILVKNSNITIDTSKNETANALINNGNQSLDSSKLFTNNSHITIDTFNNNKTTTVLIKNINQSNNKNKYPTNKTSETGTHFDSDITRPDSTIFVISPISISLITINNSDSIIPNLALHAPLLDSNFNMTSKFRGFYAGGIFALNNIWLLNQLTFDGLKGNSLNDTKIGIGYSYGISLGYNINTHWSGEINWYINSKNGQTYNIYNEGRYTSRKINMNYTTINLSLKHRIEGYNYSLHSPNSKNIIFGFNYGILKNGENKSVSEFNSQSENIGVSYYSNDYGLRIGYEYEIIVIKKLIISSALIGDIGLKNIYKGYSSLPGIYNKTYTTSLGINLGVKYLIK